jgi:MYXO-CTERM domain-containing protein
MTFSQRVAALTILGTLTLSVPAWADIPPDDQCFASMVGKPCNNAMSSSGDLQLGVCSEATCTRATPDGSMTYACYRCEPAEQGAGGQPNEGGTVGQTSGGKSAAGGSPSSAAGAAGAKSGSGGSSNGADSSKEASDDDGGCSVSQGHGAAGAFGAGLAVLGFAALGLRRRRSLES